MSRKRRATMIGVSITTGLVAAGSIAAVTALSLTQCFQNKDLSNTFVSSRKTPSWDPKYNQIKSFNTFSSKIIRTYDRKIQKESYNPEMQQKYSKYGFKYPGWNNNYEHSDSTRYITVDGVQHDMCKELLEERVTDDNGNYVLSESGNKFNYRDSEWILSEIENNKLKKHPQSDNWFKQGILNNTKAVEKQFVISTGSTGQMPLGLYAAPGEVIELKFDDESWNLLKENNFNGLEICINQNYWDNKANDDSGRISNRYPYIRSRFTIDTSNQTFKFGSPFGGIISLNINSRFVNRDSMYQNPYDISFTVSNAVEALYYVDGFTTKEDWDNQIQKVLNKTITAPVMSAIGAFASINIPFTNINEIGYKKIKDIVYPYYNFKKFNDFLFLSNYFNNRSSVHRLDVECCDDIWGGAGAWGGGNTIYCPPDWATNLLLISHDQGWFSAGDNWGFLHELNHNYQQDSALFKKTGAMHGQTNQVNFFDLSQIGDVPRYRSEYNWYGENVTNLRSPGWRRLSTAFGNINGSITSNSADEYSLYCSLMNMVGAKNYADYVRWDSAFHPNNSSDWTHMDEIKTISEHFGYNVWPAIENMSNRFWPSTSPFWQNIGDARWPRDYSSATSEEKQIIDNLNHYPSIDFVANLYASGIYKYNYENHTYIYTDDTAPVYQIPIGESYIFDFDFGIKSMNQNFQWSELEFNPTTKLGGTLYLDPTNKRKLVYNPPLDKVSEIDEFDISITPTNFTGKPSNYVPKYKWKIKVRQEAFLPTIEIFEPFDNSNINIQQAYDIINNLKPEYKWMYYTFNSRQFNSSLRQAMRYKFKFVAKDDGVYRFQNIWDDAIIFKVDGNEVFRNESWTNSWHDTYTVKLNSGDSINLEFTILNYAGVGNFNVKVINDSSNKELNIFDYILNPGIDNINVKSNYIDYFNDDSFKYKSRTVDYSVYPNSIFKSSLQFVNIDSVSYIDPNKYRIRSPYKKNAEAVLNDFGNTYLEVWNTDAGPGVAALNFTLDFNEPTKIRTLMFGHRTDNWSNARATDVTLYITDKHNNRKQVNNLIYHNRSSDRAWVILDRTYEAKRLEVYLSNKKMNALIVQWFRVSDYEYISPKEILALNNDAIRINGSWQNIINDSQYNVSCYNNSSWYSNKSGNEIQFTLKNSKGFSIVGRNHIGDADFDVYVNNKLVGESIRNDYGFNKNLYLYTKDKASDLKVRIVQKENKDLYINGIISL